MCVLIYSTHFSQDPNVCVVLFQIMVNKSPLSSWQQHHCGVRQARCNNRCYTVHQKEITAKGNVRWRRIPGHKSCATPLINTNNKTRAQEIKQLVYAGQSSPTKWALLTWSFSKGTAKTNTNSVRQQAGLGCANPTNNSTVSWRYQPSYYQDICTQWLELKSINYQLTQVWTLTPLSCERNGEHWLCIKKLYMCLGSQLSNQCK